jgi:hypothetical protein
VTARGQKFANYQAGEKRRALFLAAIMAGGNIEDGCAAAEVSRSAYWKWRSLYPEFRAKVDANRTDLDDAPAHRKIAATKYGGGFAAFRREFFGHPSPWFHLRIIEALESAVPGEITLITIPPEHGKTTTLEDFCSMKLALDPNFRITVGSEKQQHGRKILRRIKTRMEGDGPARDFVKQFGPFRAPRGDPRRTEQPWAADFFDVYKRGGFDERDYSMVALGMGSAVAGTRTDLLLVDDPQSRKSLNQTKEMVQIFRQDWLSRPGSKGTTVILMTRQGEDDFANAIIEAGVVDHHIVLSAFTDTQGFLWPERYSEAEYDIMKRNVGQEAWELNYLQIARPQSSIIFTHDTIAKGRNPLRSIADRRPTGELVTISLDPGYAVAGIAAAVMGIDKLDVLDCHKEYNVPGTEGLLQIVEDQCTRYAGDGAQIENLIIETMAFQKGFATDARLLALQQRFGFQIWPHETGMNKYDRDLGIPQIVHALLRGEIEWPWADDEATRVMLGQLEDDMYRWRPGKKGNQLEQDSLMAFWFIFLRWKLYRRSGEADPGQFSRQGADSPLWLPGQGALV